MVEGMNLSRLSVTHSLLSLQFIKRGYPLTRELAMRFELMEEVGRLSGEHGEGKPGQNTAVQNPEKQRATKEANKGM